MPDPKEWHEDENMTSLCEPDEDDTEPDEKAGDEVEVNLWGEKD